MGVLTLPANGTVYLDANGFIYSVERIDPYRAMLDILWLTVSAGQVTVVTSELTYLKYWSNLSKSVMLPLPPCSV